VLLSPTAYDELAREVQLTRDVAAIRHAMAEIKDGKGQEAGAFFDGLQAELLAMKSARVTGAAE
jgi:hypothetical protein